MKKSNIYILLAVGAVAFVLLPSCASIPKGANPVKPFDEARYLGKWYEIARLDMRFERNLNNVTAEYSMNRNGTLRVNNQGLDYVKNEWKQSIGKAKFVNDANEARLKVSFFGPFYAGYNVIEIDKDYRYALVAGPNLKYLWILSRENTIPQEIKEDYLKKAKAIGYKTDDLIWVEHNKYTIRK